MKPLSIFFGMLAVALITASVGLAQVILPGGSPFNPPVPPAPPPPVIEAPVIPKLDAPPSQPRVQPSQRGSFGDRITRCLEEGAAAGLGPNERAAYSRACAN